MRACVRVRDAARHCHATPADPDDATVSFGVRGLDPSLLDTSGFEVPFGLEVSTPYLAVANRELPFAFGTTADDIAKLNLVLVGVLVLVGLLVLVLVLVCWCWCWC